MLTEIGQASQGMIGHKTDDKDNMLKLGAFSKIPQQRISWNKLSSIECSNVRISFMSLEKKNTKGKSKSKANRLQIKMLPLPVEQKTKRKKNKISYSKVYLGPWAHQK